MSELHRWADLAMFGDASAFEPKRPTGPDELRTTCRIIRLAAMNGAAASERRRAA